MFFNYYNEKVYYEEFGEGKPILIIHGLACNIELMKGCIEPIFKKVNGYKRIYIDLLGMGKSNNCSLEYASSDKILEMLLSFIKEKIDKEFLLIGESYGGYLSRGIISKCYKSVKGLMLLCSMIIPDDSKRTLPVGNLKFHDKEILEKVLKQCKVDFHPSDSVEAMEGLLLESIIKDMWEKLSQSERIALLSDLKNDVDNIDFNSIGGIT